MFANVARLAERMDILGLDAVVATTQENVFYLTGIDSVALEMFPHSGQCYAVLSRDNLSAPHFICSRCEVDQFLDAEVTLRGATAYGPFYRIDNQSTHLDEDESRLLAVSGTGPQYETALDALTAVLGDMGLLSARIGIDEDGFAEENWSPLAERMRAGSAVACSAAFRWARRVKTDDEVRRIAAAAAVAEDGITAAISAARPGATERELVREFRRTVAGAGAKPGFTLIKFGRAAVGGQTRASDTPLRAGETIWFDVGGVVGGYWYDIARCYSLGEPSPKTIRYYEAMLIGEQRAIDEARPGMTGKELFELTMQAVRDSGVPQYQRNHVGHGIGVEVYDQVLIRPDCLDRLEAGTVVNIETPYYEYGFGAVHVEDPFVVGVDGNAILTSLDRKFGVIEP